MLSTCYFGVTESVASHRGRGFGSHGDCGTSAVVAVELGAMATVVDQRCGRGAWEPAWYSTVDAEGGAACTNLVMHTCRHLILLPDNTCTCMDLGCSHSFHWSLMISGAYILAELQDCSHSCYPCTSIYWLLCPLAHAMIGLRLLHAHCCT